MDGRPKKRRSHTPPLHRVESDRKDPYTDTVVFLANREYGHLKNESLLQLEENDWIKGEINRNDDFRNLVKEGKLLLHGKSFLLSPEKAFLNEGPRTDIDENYANGLIDGFINRELFNNNAYVIKRYHKALIDYFHAALIFAVTASFERDDDTEINEDEKPIYVCELYYDRSGLWLEVAAYHLQLTRKRDLDDSDKLRGKPVFPLVVTSQFKLCLESSQQDIEEGAEQKRDIETIPASGFKLIRIQFSNKPGKRLCLSNLDEIAVDTDFINDEFKSECTAFNKQINSIENDKLKELGRWLYHHIEQLHKSGQANAFHYAVMIFARKLLENKKSDHTSLLAFKQLRNQFPKKRFSWSNLIANKMKHFIREYEYQQAKEAMEESLFQLRRNQEELLHDDLNTVLGAIDSTKNHLRISTGRCDKLTEIMQTMSQLMQTRQSLLRLLPKPKKNNDSSHFDEESDTEELPEEEPEKSDSDDEDTWNSSPEQIKVKQDCLTEAYQQLFTKLQHLTQEISKLPWAKLVAGGLLLLLGGLTIAGSIAFSAATWGGGIPIVIAVDLLITSLIVTGISALISGASLVPTIMAGISFFKTIKYMPPKVLTKNMEKLLNKVQAAPAA